jgi:hypothetical protein
MDVRQDATSYSVVIDVSANPSVYAPDLVEGTSGREQSNHPGVLGVNGREEKQRPGCLGGSEHREVGKCPHRYAQDRQVWAHVGNATSFGNRKLVCPDEFVGSYNCVPVLLQKRGDPVLDLVREAFDSFVHRSSSV